MTNANSSKDGSKVQNAASEGGNAVGQQSPPQRDQPPSYGTQEGTYPVRPYPDIEPRPIDPSFTVFTIHHEPAWLRFLRAFFVAALIWFLFSIFVQSLVSFAHWSHKHGRLGSGKYPIPPGVTVDQCTDGSSWKETSYQSFATAYAPRHSFLPPSAFPLSSETSFNLPLNSEALFLLARGPLSSGSVDIKTSSQQKSDVASVFISVRYFRQDVFDLVKACSISRAAGEHGVGIFTPNWLNGRITLERQLYFETTIILPAYGGGSTPLLIKKFETDVPNTLHRVGDLNKQVHFQSLSLKGSNAPILVKSLYASDCTIKTSNSPIHGTFNTSRHLTIETSNDAINVDVGLENNGQMDTIPELHIRTTNGAVDAKLSLISPQVTNSVPPSHPKPKNGRVYEVFVETSNSRLNVDFPTSPPDSVLHFSGKTTNGAANVALNPVYEGTFSLQTSNHAAELREGKAKDPSGKNRMRVVVKKSAKVGHLDGSIKWVGKEGKSSDKGTVTVTTSNAPVVLYI